MKRITCTIALVLAMLLTMTIFSTASNNILSVSISEPSAKLVDGKVRYTLTFAEPITLHEEKIKEENFTCESRQVIRITDTVYDVVYSGVSENGECRIFLEESAATATGGRYSLATPESESFFAVTPGETLRKDVFDYLVKTLFGSGSKDYRQLQDSGIVVGYGVNNLGLDDPITAEQVYILNRRITVGNL